MLFQIIVTIQHLLCILIHSHYSRTTRFSIHVRDQTQICKPRLHYIIMRTFLLAVS